MTQDEIIEMANEAELCQCIWIDDEGSEIASLVAFVKLVAERTIKAEFKPDWVNYQQGRKDGAIEEREACAKLVDDNANACTKNSMAQMVLYSNATAIRARGEA